MAGRLNICESDAEHSMHTGFASPYGAVAVDLFEGVRAALKRLEPLLEVADRCH